MKIGCINSLPWTAADYAGGWLPTWSIGMAMLEDLERDARMASTPEQADSIERIARSIFNWWKRLEDSRIAMTIYADFHLTQRRPQP